MNSMKRRDASEELPPNELKVLAEFRNSHGKWRRICAHYIRRYSVESDVDTEAEFEWSDDEETAYYLEGWYENIENWGDFTSIAVSEGVIEYWYFLPPLPEEVEP